MSGALMFVGSILMFIGFGGIALSFVGVVGAVAKEEKNSGVWCAIGMFFAIGLLVGALGAAMASWA